MLKDLYNLQVKLQRKKNMTLIYENDEVIRTPCASHRSGGVIYTCEMIIEDCDTCQSPNTYLSTDVMTLLGTSRSSFAVLLCGAVWQYEIQKSNGETTIH